jgi:hypothetical protein
VISAIGAAVQVILTEIHPTTPTPAARAVVTVGGSTLLAKYQAQVKALGSTKARLADIATRSREMK